MSKPSLRIVRLTALSFAGQPFFPGHELDADATIVDEQISIAAAPNRVGSNFLHLLCHDPDIGGPIIAPVVEAIKFEAVAEARKGHDVLLETDVGATSTAASAAAAAATTAAAATHMTSASASTHTLTAAAMFYLGTTPAFWSCHLVRASIAEARLTALRIVARLGAIARVEGIWLGFGLMLGLAEVWLLAFERGLLTGSARPLLARALAEIGLVAGTWSVAEIWPLVVSWTFAEIGAIAGALIVRLQNLVAASAAIVELAVSRFDRVVGE